MDDKTDAAYSLAMKRCKDYRRLERLAWVSNLGSGVVSSTLTLLVPFATAAMLWIPQPRQRELNIFVLVCSGLSAVLQFIPSTLRVQERARQVRIMHGDLELALAKYECGLLSREQLIEILANLEKSHMNEI